MAGENVSIHAPARGATFNDFGVEPKDIVSIHAPARGATSRAARRSIAPVAVSIHAPARGATFEPVSVTVSLMVFQSTRPRGARRVSIA